ncbi:MAG: flippase [Clostridia bacterium]|nr:flippase [Clostridia bacterium]
MAEGKKSVVRNYMYNLIYQVLILILPLITTPYLSRVLGAEGVGIYGYTYSIVTYFVLFGSLGIALYGQREIAYVQNDPKKRKKVFLELITFRFITLAIAVLVYCLIFLRDGQYRQYYLILLIELIAAGFDISWFFQGIEDFKRTVLRNVLVRLASVTLVFVIVKTSSDLWKFVLIYSLADLLGNLLLWFYLPRYLRGYKVGKLNLKIHLIPLLMLFIPQVTNKVYNLLDTTMLGAIVSNKQETGYYEQSQKVIRLLITIVTSLGVVMIPRVASIYASGDNKKINAYIKNSFTFVFFISFPMMFGIASIARDFVPIFFGEGYDKSATLIMIFCPMILLMGIENVIGTQYMLPTKRQKEYTISVLAGVVVNLILNAIFINLWQSVGASIATILSQVVVDSVQIYFVRKDIKWKPLIRIAVRYLVSSLFMFGACMLVKLLIHKAVITIIVQMLVGVGVYVGMLILFRDRFLNTILDRIKGKVSEMKLRFQN